MKGAENLKIQDELKNQEDLKRRTRNKYERFYYICSYDNKKFLSQKLFINYFRKEHAVICNILGKEFESKYTLKRQNNTNIINYKICKCKVCGKAFATNNALKSNCKDKNIKFFLSK